MSTTIFLDESGHTGPHLNNRDQPHFALASLRIAEEEARDLRERYFSRSQAEELKHQRLARRSSGRKSILSFLEHLINDSACVKTWVVDKRFACVANMVEFVLEPAMCDSGVNLYERGGNVALSNLLYIGLGLPSAESFAARLSDAYLAWVRQRDGDSLCALRAILGEGTLELTDNPILSDLLPAISICIDRLDEPPPKDSLDFALTAAFQLLAWWRYEIDGEIEVAHDVSANMSRREDVWRALTNPDWPPRVFAAPSSTLKMKFPVAVSRTQFLRSEDSAGLQLADVVAGTYTNLLKLPADDRFRLDLLELIGELPVHAMLPTDLVTPDQLNTEHFDGADFLDFVTDGLARHGGAADDH